MQLFIIHFLILPIKKFKKQKLKIIFFNFLNKCNRYNIYCVSYYKGSRSAFHRSRVRAYVAGPSSEFVREITASGLRSGFTTQATDYYYGMVTNLSSDAFTIKSFSITF
ncbi:hypothetical protein [Blautia massiliensis (ex Durand et al. 2017)]|uniref:hypothetical protein n=1 Tax=Blautia massiliensis (ex Durand et al. 2017) TaxID=1737424 RepID=UPI003562A67C